MPHFREFDDPVWCACFQEGWDAFFAETNCPYHATDDEYKWNAWWEGWRDAENGMSA